MVHTIITIEYTDLLIPALISLVIWFYLIRSAMRADSLVKNQEFILHTLIQIYKKNGATEEDMKQLQEHFDK